MAVALLGWLAHLFLDPGTEGRGTRPGTRGGAVMMRRAWIALALSLVPAGIVSAQTTSTPASPAAQSQGPAAASEGTDAGATAVTHHADSWAGPGTWSTFNGDLRAQKFSPETQITPGNVKSLEMAWQYHTGDVSDGSGDKPKSVWSATPLFVNDTVYLGTPFYRIIALEPDTGKVKWTFDPHAVLKALTQPELKNRGVAYWQAEDPKPGEACQKMVYIGTMDAKLYGVDADTGKPCPGFGQNGMVDVNQWNPTRDKWPLSLLQPPTVYNDTLFLGWAGKDWEYKANPAGSVFALDAHTGKLKWTFDALPKDAARTTGTSNVWASMSIDPETGLLYIPVSSPSPNFYGGAREEKLPLATSVTALDVDTGKVVWSRQLVHHDVWDYDTNSPAGAGRHQEGRQDDPGPGAVGQDRAFCSFSTAGPASPSTRSRRSRPPPPTSRASRLPRPSPMWRPPRPPFPTPGPASRGSPTS